MKRALAAERTARHAPNHRPRSLLEWRVLTLILLAAAFLRFHDLGNVPKGLEHCPLSEGVSYILVFEPRVVVSEGD